MEEEVKLDLEVWVGLEGKEERNRYNFLQAERPTQSWSVNLLPLDTGQS